MQTHKVTWSSSSLRCPTFLLSWLFVCECHSDGSGNRARYDPISISNSTLGVEKFMEFMSSGRRRKSRKVCFPRIATILISHVNLYYIVS